MDEQIQAVDVKKFYDPEKAKAPGLKEVPKPYLTAPKVTPKKSFGQKILGAMDAQIGNTGVSVSDALGAVDSVASSILGEKSEYSGLAGETARNADELYDVATNAVGAIPVFGNAAKGLMMANKLVNKVANKLGAGTDGMTAKDSILGSPFFTPLGIINGAFGSRAHDYASNSWLLGQTNGGFNGLTTADSFAKERAGKKFGLASQHEKGVSNIGIDYAAAMQSGTWNIVDTNQLNELSAQASTPFITMANQIDLSGGVKSTLSTKNGGTLQFANRVISASKFSNGGAFGKILDSKITANNRQMALYVLNFLKNFKFSDGTRLSNNQIAGIMGNATTESAFNANVRSKSGTFHGLWQNGKQIQKYMQKTYDNINHNGQMQFLKDWLNSFEYSMDGLAYGKYTGKGYRAGNHATAEDSADTFRKYYERTEGKAEERRKYAKEWLTYLQNTPSNFADTEQVKQPVNTQPVAQPVTQPIIQTQNDDLISLNEPTNYEFNTDFNFDKLYNDVFQNVQYAKSGGKFNVIPEGALHKNKHHLADMDEKFEEVTDKGIPVITEAADGSVLQHAEVEKEEIIFRLDVTKKLEELKKENTDEAAIEAGKLLVKEILHNTIDNANILNNE